MHIALHLSIPIAVAAAACAPRLVSTDRPAPVGAAVRARFDPPTPLTLLAASGETLHVAAVQEVLGKVQGSRADTLSLGVTKLTTADGHTSGGGTAVVVPAPGIEVEVLSTRPGLTNVLGLGLLAGFIAWVVFINLAAAATGT